jgi:integrase
MSRKRQPRKGRKPRLPENMFWRNDTIYGQFQINGQRHKVSLGTNDIAEAEKVLDEKIAQAWKHSLDGKQRRSFKEQFDYVYPRRWEKRATAQWHQQISEQIIATLGDFYLDEVSEDWCWKYIEKRRSTGSRINTVNPKPISDGTINKELAFVKRVMLTVDEDDYYMPKKRQMDNRGAPTFPIVQIARRKTDEQRTNPLRDEAEALELINEMVAHARPIILTMLLTGLRRENVMQLDIKKNIRWNQRQIVVTQKGDKEHVVGMCDDLYYLLRNVVGERKSGPVFIFGINGCKCMNCNELNQRTGKPNTQALKGRIKSIRTTFYTARKQIGREDVRIHDLRHTLGTWLNARGVDINIIKEILGHADIATTQRYLHVNVDTGRDAINDKVGFLLTKGEQNRAYCDPKSDPTPLKAIS